MESLEGSGLLNGNEKTALRQSLEMLKRYSFWEDKLPEEVVHSDNIKEKEYKGRKHWWQCVTLLLDDFANEQKTLSSNLEHEVNDFCKEYCSSEFTRRLTTKEDIEKANKIVNKVLTEVSEKLC
jgi:hypothetical protein